MLLSLSPDLSYSLIAQIYPTDPLSSNTVTTLRSTAIVTQNPKPKLQSSSTKPYNHYHLTPKPKKTNLVEKTIYLLLTLTKSNITTAHISPKIIQLESSCQYDSKSITTNQIRPLTCHARCTYSTVHTHVLICLSYEPYLIHMRRTNCHILAHIIYHEFIITANMSSITLLVFCLTGSTIPVF